MLASHFSPAKSEESTQLLVFIHGFLGAGDDWLAVSERLPDYSRLTIDLPGHGKSYAIKGESFDQVCKMIRATILNCIEAQKLGTTVSVCLVGYSLGARLAMYLMTDCHSNADDFNSLNINGLVIEGGNFGLETKSHRSARLDNDSQWAERFRDEEIAAVLTDWYRQPVFSSLNHEQRQLLIAKRSVNLGSALSDMLLATSLAKQPYLLPQVQALSFNQGRVPLYICGALDHKFTELAKESNLQTEVIANAGHNVHKEQPEAFASKLRNYLEQKSLGLIK